MTSPNVDADPGPERRSGVRHAPLSGHQLGRYRLGDRLGSGGAASVYVGLLRGPHDWERLVALKVVHEHLLDQADFVGMFLDEANLAVRLTHPNVVHSYELGHEGPWLFLAMEYLHGQTLASLLSKSQQKNEALPLDLMAWIGAEAAKGLAYAHSLASDDGTPLCIVHRDVSPHNVFLTYDGQVKVIDFGIARSTQRITQTGLGQVKGKFRYMAPEQLLGKHFDHRADIFALGATVYEATVGQRPFPADDEAEALANLVTEDAPKPETIRPDYPAELSSILMRALAREPDSRYGDALSLARDLQQFVASKTDGEPSAHLAALLDEWFDSERARQDEAIARLREQRPESSGIHTFDTELPAPEGTRRKPGRIAVIAAAALAAAVGVAAAVLPSPRPEPAGEQMPSVTVAPAKETVTIDVTVQPKAAATISIDGKVIDQRPARVELEPGSEPIPVVVTADGYETARLEAVPDRDHFIVVPLIKTAPAPSAAREEKKPPSPPSPPARPVRSAPARRRPPAAASPSAEPKPAPAAHDPLVTDYPF